MKYEELTGRIIAACFEVNNELGCGFLESIYQNALAIALEGKRLQVAREYPLSVFSLVSALDNSMRI